MIFDYVTRIWMNEDSTFQVNGCVKCGQLAWSHGSYTLCYAEDNRNMRYVAPSDALRLERMKANRALRTK
jgi:hypothetical protein